MGNKICHQSDQEVRIYVATKLFPFAYHKELYLILVGPGWLFPVLFAPIIAYGPYTGFFNERYTGPYGPYDNF